MAEGPAPKKPTSTAGAAASDAFAALPDEILQHVLSFLPAQPAVRTCVLARRWRRLWEGAAGLRITAANAPEPVCKPDDLVSSAELREFVDHLLLLRGGAPLDSCEFMFDVRDDADVPHVNLWIRHVIRCQVRRLELSITREEDPTGLHFYVDNLPLVSRHLRRLELNDTGLNDSFLDLSGCPGFEDLYISNGGFVHAKRISSKSVKHLTVIDSSFNKPVRTVIDVPSVVSLQLEDPWDRTPVLGSMPLLAVAFVRLGTDSIMSLDWCYKSESGDCNDEHCQGCYGLEGDSLNGSNANGAKKNKSVLLNGLSEAKSLVLIDESHKFIFKRDLKCCPMFRMLKTLLLNEYWCVPPDFRELACLLEYSPVLEKLTLQIFFKFEIIASYSQMEGSAAISKNLKIVEVKFEVADEGVLKVYNFLQTLNIDFNFDEEEESLVEDVSTTS
ncbi:F-box/LRR-repeat protein At3g59200 isoform X2 [Sorghum bicolor]|uniref:F-box/LRR-repeat protein At3g59200 isoform X2 n=1 Tax=Sorghum bicolor TaxID=4558 RepID=UPI000B424F22|nr:F-box/LRR-repeat protein At3g59200 isoform X2 [Sorghum bicolor]|eukprot:XP_021316736.1 F-box/LRR-repeat protein At3g59200 isoform X2 [Sorghum bicolor]